MTKIAIIGSGFSGLSAACYLSKAGHEVHIYEKNSTIGGRARQIKTESGYVFDMGPSWYWMPDVFEKFYNDFGYTAADFYELILLSPAFNIVFPESELLTIPSNFDEICELFESLEKGSSLKLQAFMKDAQYKYDVGMKKLVYKPGLSLTEFLDIELIKGVFKLEVFTSFSKHVRSYFKHPKLIALMEFPVLFLGAMPKDTPALYSLMNYAGLKLGTWYPVGGFGTVIDAMAKIAIENKVKIFTNSAVEKINSNNKVVSGIKVNGENLDYDYVISSADYNHTESQLLSSKERNYSVNYWNKKVFAPSCLIYYIGLNKRVKNLEHHTLFFEEDLDQHAVEIYKQPEWPSKPLFYVCCPSKTDNTVAPAGHENLFLLMPIAPDLKDTEEIREQYFKVMMERLEKQVGERLMDNIDYKQSYCVEDFKMDYNSFKGNAYGLANTLMQTANLKPSIKSNKIENLYYVGQLTVPGPGVPPSIISGKIAAELILNKTN